MCCLPASATIFYFIFAWLPLLWVHVCVSVCVLSPSKGDYSDHVLLSLMLAIYNVSHPEAEQSLVLGSTDTGSEGSHLAAASSPAHRPCAPPPNPHPLPPTPRLCWCWRNHSHSL